MDEPAEHIDATDQTLSDRECDVLDLSALSYANQEIGKKLYISVRSVDTHRANIMGSSGSTPAPS